MGNQITNEERALMKVKVALHRSDKIGTDGKMKSDVEFCEVKNLLKEAVELLAEYEVKVKDQPPSAAYWSV